MTRARRPIRKKRLDGLCIIRSTASKICCRGISLKTLVTLRNEHAFRQRGPRMALTNLPPHRSGSTGSAWLLPALLLPGW
jgi:hypothetical protein